MLDADQTMDVLFEHKYHRLAAVLYRSRYGSYDFCIATSLYIHGRITLYELQQSELENLTRLQKAKLVD
jgi:hypothetical protein